MGVIYFKELPGKSGSVNTAFQRTYIKSWVMRTDSPTDTEWTVGSYASLPKIFDPYPDDPTGRAFCVNVNPVQDTQDPTKWITTATFANTIDGWAGGAGSGGGLATGNPFIDSQQQGVAPADRKENPLERPRDYSYGTVVVGQRAVRRDTETDEEFLNTAGDPVLNPPMEDIVAGNITIGLNATIAPGNAWTLAYGKLNAGTLTIDDWVIPAKKARVGAVTANKVREYGISYWRWSINFQVMEDWKWKTLSMGNRAWTSVKDKATGTTVAKKLAITEIDRYMAGPQLLDEFGLVVTEAAGNTPYEHQWNTKKTVTLPSPL